MSEDLLLIETVRKEFQDIVDDFQKIIKITNQTPERLSEALKQFGDLSAHLDNVAPKIDSLGQRVVGLAAKKAGLVQRINDLEFRLKEMFEEKREADLDNKAEAE